MKNLEENIFYFLYGSVWDCVFVWVWKKVMWYFSQRKKEKKNWKFFCYSKHEKLQKKKKNIVMLCLCVCEYYDKRVYKFVNVNVHILTYIPVFSIKSYICCCCRLKEKFNFQIWRPCCHHYHHHYIPLKWCKIAAVCVCVHIHTYICMCIYMWLHKP